MISLKAADGHELAAVLHLPEGNPRGGLVIIQDTYGIGDYIRSVAADYAALGYTCIVPALYDRQERGANYPRTEEGMEASQALRRAVVWPDILMDVEAARVRIAEYGKVGIVGFCFGGSVVWYAAQRLPFAAASSYYGRDVPHWLDLPPLCPTICHFGERDTMIPLEGVHKINPAMPQVPVHVYPAGHGFDNPATGTDPEVIALGRKRTLELFRAYVG